MDFTFLKTEVEAYAFFASFIFYLALVIVVLDKHNKIIRNKKLDNIEGQRRKRRVYIMVIIGLLICGIIHYVLYSLFFFLIPSKNPITEPRSEYLLSILITMVIFLAIILFGFFLKGSSTLPKHEGPVSGV